MPKPFTEHPGSGMHTHFSLFEGEKNAFYKDGSTNGELSNVGKSFIAGILKHAPEFIAVTNQWVNSYKRLHGGGEAPAKISWGAQNRDAMIRIPRYKPNKENSTRIEFRAPDSACNPYLAFAVTIAAGLKGVESGYELGIDESPASLPADLNEAILAMQKSELVRQCLGEHLFDYFLRNKRAEWLEYSKQVTAFELDRYLPVL
jgi:glutamine synthetase